MAKQDTEQRHLPPSLKKLKDARKKGQVAKSRDMLTAASFMTLTVYLGFRWRHIFHQFGMLIDTAGRLVNAPFSQAAPAMAQASLNTLANIVLPALALSLLAVTVAAIVTLRGIVVSFDPISPKFENINPLEGFKRLFKLRALIELVKTIVKILGLGGVIILAFLASLRVLGTIPEIGLAGIPPVFAQLMIPIMAVTAGLFLATGLADIGLQGWLFRRDQRMSHSEQKRERKDSEGDPKFRQYRKQRAQEASYAGARLGVDSASLVIHDDAGALVALRFINGETPVPVVVARVRNSLIKPMLRHAAELDLPVVEDAELAEAIAQGAAPGSFIPQSTYRQVAMLLARLGLFS